jgi:microcystin-dependent protein
MSSLAGEVILWASPRIPEHYLPCDGRLIAVEQYPDLFDLVGYSYGGSGAQFALPTLTAPQAANDQAGPGKNSLSYIIATDGLSGSQADFGNAAGLLGDVRFLVGPPVPDMSGARLADGWYLPVNLNFELFTLIGTTYGPVDTAFALPNVPSLMPAGGPGVPAYVVIQGYYPPPQNGSPLGDNLLGEIRLSAVSFTPGGWAPTGANELLPISQNTALFSLLGTSFGGDGNQTFGLPQLEPLANVPHNIAVAGIYPSFS